MVLCMRKCKVEETENKGRLIIMLAKGVLYALGLSVEWTEWYKHLALKYLIAEVKHLFILLSNRV